MGFAAPVMLWGLLLLAIPIVVHLFSFRRFKTVYFSDIRFLKQVEEETSTKNKWKHLLVLLSRLLAILFLVLAFAQPYRKDGAGAVQATVKAVSIYLDNSFSMEAQHHGSMLLEEARKQAMAVVDAYGVDDKFQLITNQADGLSATWLSAEEAKQAITQVVLTPRVRQTGDVFQQQADMLYRSGMDAVEAYQIGDFQRSTTSAVSDTMVPVTLIQVGGKQSGNVSLDTAWFTSPVQVAGEQSALVYRISNHGNDDRTEVGITLTVGNQVKALQTLDVAAGGRVTDTVVFTVSGEGWQQAVLSLTDYPVSFDDRLFITFRPASEAKVLCVQYRGTSDAALRAIYRQPVFSFTTVSAGQVDYNQLAQYEVVLLLGIDTWSSGLVGALQSVLDAGGSVVVMPMADADVASMNDNLMRLAGARYRVYEGARRTTSGLNWEHAVFQGVFEATPENMSMPYLAQGFQPEATESGRVDGLIQFSDGSFFAAAATVGSGMVYLLPAVPMLPFTDLSTQAGVFVPMMYRIGLLSQGGYKPYLVSGSEEWVRLPAGWVQEGEEVVPEVSHEAQTFIPSIRRGSDYRELSLFPYAEKEGFYTVNPDQPILQLALNHDRRESDLQLLNEEELRSLYPKGTRFVEAGKRSQGVATASITGEAGLWKFCIIFTLLFLAIEILLIRFWP